MPAISRVVIFPEGGIAPSGERLPFKSGAFALAIETGVPVVPVAIRGTDLVLPPRGRLAVRPGKVEVRLLVPVSTEGLHVEDRGVLRDSVRDILIAVARGMTCPLPGPPPTTSSGPGWRWHPRIEWPPPCIQAIQTSSRLPQSRCFRPDR